jgi:exopolysaccharide biosynthesis polyprenyl glycosylphosphotransferase
VVGDKKDGADAGKWLGSYADLRGVLDSRQVDHVILALPHEDYGRLAGLLDAIGDEPVTIHLVPDLLCFTSLRGGVEDFEGMPLIHLRESPLHGWNRLLKRVFDVAFAGATLVLLTPVLLAVAAAVKASSPGPAFFGQERMGLDGQRFRMLKFRTMCVNAEEMKADLQHLSLVAYPDFKMENDPRVTPIGSILRATFLDELPQLINVVRGDMSLVGPRPTSFAASTYNLWHTERLEAKPGITGLWQVQRSDGETCFDERLRLDVEYLRTRTVLGDLKIMLATVTSTVRRAGK